jgi:hypothetical protein
VLQVTCTCLAAPALAYEVRCICFETVLTWQQSKTTAHINGVCAHLMLILLAC